MGQNNRDRAVSSVIGNSVLIAVTVILAVAVTTFALGFAVHLLFFDGDGQETSDPPEATFSITYQEPSDAVVITHTGGDKIPADRLTVRRDQETVPMNWPGDPIVPGDAVRLKSVADGDRVAVVWNTPEESQSWVLNRTRIAR
jgi:flagellin-like protein